MNRDAYSTLRRERSDEDLRFAQRHDIPHWLRVESVFHAGYVAAIEVAGPVLSEDSPSSTAIRRACKQARVSHTAPMAVVHYRYHSDDRRLPSMPTMLAWARRMRAAAGFDAPGRVERR
jgi:hypothetical protein